MTAENIQAGLPQLADINLDKDGQVVDFVVERWRKRDQHRFALERQWLINCAMYLGFQNLEFAETVKALRQPNVPPWRVRMIANRLQYVVRRVVSKILRQRPHWVVSPATEDQEDNLTALLSERVLRYFWGANNVDADLIEAVTWMAICGNSFMRAFWDPTKGQEFEIRPQDVGRNGDGQRFFRRFFPDKRKKLPESIVTALGDAAVEVCSPFECDPDPFATRWSDIGDLIQTKMRSRQYLIDRYGEDIKEGEGGEDHNLSYHFQQQIAALAGPSGIGGITRLNESGLILEHTLYVRPTRKQRQGYWAVVAGGRLLQKGPLDVGAIPFIHLMEIPVPQRIWGTCVMEQAIPLQVGYNRVRSQIIENANQMGRPKWLNPLGSGVMEQNFSNEPGEVIEHLPGLEPKPVPPPPLPEYIQRNADSLISDMNDVTGIHEVSQAKVPGGVRAGIAIAALQEQDDSLLAPTLLNLENSLSQLGQWVLKLIAKYVDEERLVKIAGKGRKIETFTFKGRDLLGKKSGRPGVNYFDVRVEMGSQLPFSKAARAQFVMEMVQYGILRPQESQEHQEKVLEMLELGSEGPMVDEGQKERANAHRENMVMADMQPGETLAINPWDMDEIHIEVLRGFQRMPDYVTLIREKPHVAEIFEAHIQEHVAVASGGQQAAAPQGAPTGMGAGMGDQGLQELAGLVASQGQEV